MSAAARNARGTTASAAIVERRDEALEAWLERHARDGADREPGDDAARDGHQALSNDHAYDVAGRRAERHAHADLARAANDDVRQHAVETDEREDPGERSQEARDAAGDSSRTGD